MNIFKIDRGDFFGIIIPGAFLVINLLILFKGEMLGAYLFPAPESAEGIGTLGKGMVYFFIFFIAAYVFGMGLRAISPDLTEKMSVPIWFAKELLNAIVIFFTLLIGRHLAKYEIFRYIISRTMFFDRILKARKSKSSLIRYVIRERLRRIRDNFETYPYIEWFYRNYLPGQSKPYRSFYRKILSELGGKRSRLKGNMFMNFCRVMVYGTSEALHEEIVFSEGMARFFSGMFLSSFISIGVIILSALDILDISLKFEQYVYFLVLYILLLLIFGYKIKFMRMKETLAVLDAFYFIENNINTKDSGSSVPALGKSTIFLGNSE